jgi:hypothetical protein
MMRTLAAACLTFVAFAARGEAVEVSGKVSWGTRAVCDRAQGRKLVFSGDAGKSEAAVGDGGAYRARLEPGHYRVTLRCGGTDIKSVDVIAYPTATRQDLAF